MQRSREWDGTGFSRSQRDRYYFRNQRNPNQDFDILRWNLTKVEQFMYTWLILIMRIRLTHEFHPVAVEIEGLTLMIPPCKLSSPFSNLIRIQIVLSIRVTEGWKSCIEFLFCVYDYITRIIYFNESRSLIPLVLLHHDLVLFHSISILSRPTMIRLFYYARPVYSTFLTVIGLACPTIIALLSIRPFNGLSYL